jgi:hypothetical protein
MLDMLNIFSEIIKRERNKERTAVLAICYLSYYCLLFNGVAQSKITNNLINKLPWTLECFEQLLVRKQKDQAYTELRY